MIKTFKYKLYHYDKQDIDHHINIACYIYNHCIALHKRYYLMYKKSLNANHLKKHLTKLKKTKRFSFFKKLNSQAIQDIVERIEKGYKAFFKKTSKHSPTFKSKKRYKSFGLKQCGYKFLEGNRVKIGKKIYRYWKSRDLIGTIKFVTVKRDSLGDKYILIVCDIKDEIKIKPSHGKTTGFDFGLKTFLVDSDNNNYESPLFYNKHLNNLRKASRIFSRKVKGSSNRESARKNLVRNHHKVSACRRDFMMKLSNGLVKDNDILCFEDLDLEGMKKRWGRKVSDLSFAEFLKIVEYKCLEKNKKMIKIDRYYPSSKTCSCCGWVKKDLLLSDRDWVCKECSTLHDRDHNAAKNIRARALASVERSKT